MSPMIAHYPKPWFKKNADVEEKVVEAAPGGPVPPMGVIPKEMVPSSGAAMGACAIWGSMCTLPTVIAVV